MIGSERISDERLKEIAERKVFFDDDMFNSQHNSSKSSNLSIRISTLFFF